MKIIPIIKKIESIYTKPKFKNKFHHKVSKGDFISVIYFDLDKEQVRLQQFIGYCIKLQSKGINTKMCVRNKIGRVVIEQQFFLYSRSVVDIAVLRRK